MPSSTQILNSLYDTTVESKPVWTNHAKQRPSIQYRRKENSKMYKYKNNK